MATIFHPIKFCRLYRIVSPISPNNGHFSDENGFSMHDFVIQAERECQIISGRKQCVYNFFFRVHSLHIKIYNHH